jgi:arsenical pump membrane protein
MTLAYANILENTNHISNIYSTIIGSNLGALLTPIGALAGIMWLRILKENDIKYSFIDFMKNGIIITGFTLGVSAIMLLMI